MAAKIKLTDEERPASSIIYFQPIQTGNKHRGTKSKLQSGRTTRTMSKCSKKWKLRFKDTKGHFRTHHDQLIEAGAGHAAESMFDVFLKQSEILK